jgi:hypothetical protein
MNILSTLSVSLVLSLSAACAHSPSMNTAAASPGSSACPDAVRQSIAKDFAGATITACKAESEDGHDQFEVKLDQRGKTMEVDVAPDGTVLQTEAVIPVADVPAKVMAAFSAKYSGKTAIRIEKQVRTGKGSFYEIKFEAQPKAKEVTFAEDGTFVEEE